MQDIFIMAIIMAVPITGILSATFLKYKKLKLQQGKDSGHITKALEQLTQTIQTLAKENTELRQRIENLETIVTLGDIFSNLKQVSERNGGGEQLPPVNQEHALSGEIAKIIADREKFK